LALSKRVTCPPCGAIIQGETDDDLVAKLQQHSRDEHGMSLSRDQILAMAASLRTGLTSRMSQ
jgi:predicted small metal-binding protein